MAFSLCFAWSSSGHMEIASRHSQSPLYRWASLRTELLWIYDGPVLPENRKVQADHTLGYWVWLVRRGKVQAQMEGRTWQAVPGQWMVAPQGATIQEFSNDARILSVHFRCQWPAGDNLFSGREALVWSAKDYPRLEKSALS